MDLGDVVYSARDIIEMFGNINWLLDSQRNNPRYPWLPEKVMATFTREYKEAVSLAAREFVKTEEYTGTREILEKNRKVRGVDRLLKEWYIMEKEFFKNLE